MNRRSWAKSRVAGALGAVFASVMMSVALASCDDNNGFNCTSDSGALIACQCSGVPCGTDLSANLDLAIGDGSRD